jgi:hypothetical protein
MDPLAELAEQSITEATTFRGAWRQRVSLVPVQESLLISTATFFPIQVDPKQLEKLNSLHLSPNSYGRFATTRASHSAT